MAARARLALGRAWLRGSRTGAWRIWRALCAAQTASGSFAAVLAASDFVDAVVDRVAALNERSYNRYNRLPLLLLLRAAFPVQLVRRGVALDPDVVHGLRAELDRSACQDPRPVAAPGPCAARDEVNVARPALHSPHFFIGVSQADRREQGDSRENP